MTKEDLEKIWNSAELGWLQRYSKNTKKKEKRKLRITFYEKVTKHTIEEIVWTGKNDTASSFAYVVLNRLYDSHKDWPTSNYETRFVHD
jgi:hypothetical protein